MQKGDYEWGYWIDSQGNTNHVCYKNKWGEHIFTTDEKKKLLSGKEVTFIYRGNSITGHLQFCNYDGKEYFGFKPDFDEGYDQKPIFRSVGKQSLFELDLQKENDVMAEYMRVYHYAKLLNDDQTVIRDFHRIADVRLQKDGVDVMYSRNGKQYVIDEKAQMDYIYNPNGPLPTFALELLNSSSGAIGWFINSRLKTEYYMFIWPHADKKPLCVDNISYAYYALVNKKRLLLAIENKCAKSPQHLFEYAKRISMYKIGTATYDVDGCVKDYRYGYDVPVDGFDRDAYLVYSTRKHERPVNLVVKREWLEELAEAYGTIKGD